MLGAVSNGAEVPTEGRSLAAVMLRRLFSNEFEEFFGKVRRGNKRIENIGFSFNLLYFSASGGTEIRVKRADYQLRAK